MPRHLAKAISWEHKRGGRREEQEARKSSPAFRGRLFTFLFVNLQEDGKTPSTCRVISLNLSVPTHGSPVGDTDRGHWTAPFRRGSVCFIRVRVGGGKVRHQGRRDNIKQLLSSTRTAATCESGSCSPRRCWKLIQSPSYLIKDV